MSFVQHIDEIISFDSATSNGASASVAYMRDKLRTMPSSPKHDRHVEAELQFFIYLPFAHSEVNGDQERSVALNRRFGEPNLSHAKRHRDIVRRFGRFPHRNPILGRATTEEEQRYLDEGGYAG